MENNYIKENIYQTKMIDILYIFIKTPNHLAVTS